MPTLIRLAARYLIARIIEIQACALVRTASVGLILIYTVTMTKTEQVLATACAWCGATDGLELVSEHVHVTNAQVAMEHTVGRCRICDKTTALAQWGREVRFRYKVLEYKRFFRLSTWVAVYDVICAWCGSRATEPLEINITVANPVSERFRYDLYLCRTCSKTTAISYLGDIRTHCAVRDDIYQALWYLDPE